MAKLDKADRALCFTSGMAALAAVAHLVGTGAFQLTHHLYLMIFFSFYAQVLVKVPSINMKQFIHSRADMYVFVKSHIVISFFFFLICYVLGMYCIFRIVGYPQHSIIVEVGWTKSSLAQHYFMIKSLYLIRLVH